MSGFFACCAGDRGWSSRARVRPGHAGITFRNGKLSQAFSPSKINAGGQVAAPAIPVGGGGLSLAGTNCKVSVIKCRFESNTNLVKNTDPIANGWGGAVFIFPSMLSVNFQETARFCSSTPAPPPQQNAACAASSFVLLCCCGGRIHAASVLPPSSSSTHQYRALLTTNNRLPSTRSHPTSVLALR